MWRLQRMLLLPGLVLGLVPAPSLRHRAAGQLRRTRSTTMRLNPTSFEGSDMTITEYPHPVLRRRGADVVDFDDDLRQTCKEMMSIMYQATGVGLAAPQVGLGLRLFVYNPTGDPKLKMFEQCVCNPTILEYSSTTDVEDEGCLSSRSDCCDGAVCRAKWLWVEYKDERGRPTKRRLSGFEARVFQHEYDHIEGVLHVDRFNEDDRKRVQAQLDEMVAAYTGDEPGILDISEDVRAALQPPPTAVRSGRMPPPAQEELVAAKKKPKAPPKAGFAAKGAGGAGAKAKAKPKPKKKKR